jgi:V8-like Glu-specific endopeptidase
VTSLERREETLLTRLNLSLLQGRTLAEMIRRGFAPPELDACLSAHLGRNLHDYVNVGTIWHVQTQNLIDKAEMDWWTDELLAAIRACKPQNQDFYRFAENLGLTVRTSNGQNLEKLVVAADFANLPRMIEGLSRAESAVCRVEVTGFGGGTGFLVGPDLVLTNHHVVTPLIDGEISVSDVRMRFDFKELADGSNFNPGVVVRVDSGQPVVYASPGSALDEDAAHKDEQRAETELDFALLRTDTRVGDLPPPGLSTQAGDQQARPRGWLIPPEPVSEPQPGDRLIIVQHPQQSPMVVDFGAIQGYNLGKTRVHYTTNTQKGSSGSPCFDSRMRLVALHHAGDPADAPRAAYNQGIPIGRIRTLLRAEGISEAFAG